MPNSPHTAGWLRLLAGRGWRVTVVAPDASPNIEGIPDRRARIRGGNPDGVASPLPGAAGRQVERILDRAVGPLTWRAHWLSSVIKRVQPTLIHSLEFQHCGYICLRAKQHRASLPPWIATNWGSDISYFSKDPFHRRQIVSILQEADYYGAECHRDVELALGLGFKGQLFPVVPNNGGFDLAWARSLGSGPPSTRRLIMLKGYEHFSGRATNALAAIRDCRSLLRGYAVRVYSAARSVRRLADELRHEHDIDIECLPKLAHGRMLAMHGSARTSLSIGISDGISISMLEAMVMGSYPIQSDGSCAGEWIVHRQTGAIVNAEDVGEISRELELALTHDDLVDVAATANARLADIRLDRASIREIVLEAYSSAAGDLHV